MNIAILSGKGGTGKTTVATNLAVSMRFGYVDSDVEEPNGFLFLEPEIRRREEVFVGYPFIEEKSCILCNACAEVCQFHALCKVNQEMVIFPKLCHDCGACGLVCSQGALSYKNRTIGVIEHGVSNGITCIRGILQVGEPMAVPVIRKLLGELEKNNWLLDCPPGTSCNVVNALRYTDVAILVTEPTVFGFHDLQMAVELVEQCKIPFGIIINKADGKNKTVKEFCNAKNIPLLGEIPYAQKAAVIYSNGKILCENECYQEVFQKIAARCKEVFL